MFFRFFIPCGYAARDGDKHSITRKVDYIMKKIIALALTIAVLCCVPSFALADVGYTTTVPLFDYDFETAETVTV